MLSADCLHIKTLTELFYFPRLSHPPFNIDISCLVWKIFTGPLKSLVLKNNNKTPCYNNKVRVFSFVSDSGRGRPAVGAGMHWLHQRPGDDHGGFTSQTADAAVQCHTHRHTAGAEEHRHEQTLFLGEQVRVSNLLLFTEMFVKSTVSESLCFKLCVLGSILCICRYRRG